MSMFCPNCGNILSVEEYLGRHRFKCRTCPYTFNVIHRIGHYTYPKLKEVDDILGGAAAWQNVDATEINCPVCRHPRAYFMQLQTRSADEPMTIFYKCCSTSCGHNWRD